jgi:uncharacterized protein
MNRVKALSLFLDVLLFACIVNLVIFLVFKIDPLPTNVALKFVAVGLIAFFVEYINSSIGMGYGTILSPVLIILGFPLKTVVPAILLTELIIGIPAGILHHKMGNVSFKLNSRPTKIVLLLTVCSFLGAVGAVYLVSILPVKLAQGFVSTIIVIVGLAFFLKKSKRITFSWIKLSFLGVLAAFNKASSGGGYGPLTTGGQIIAGIPDKSAIPITILSKAFVGAVGVVSYYLIEGATPDWSLLLPLIVGSIIPLIPAVMTVKILPQEKLHTRLGIFITFLGAIALFKTFFMR